MAAAVLKLWPLLAAWVAGSLSGGWQSSLLAGMAEWELLL